MVWSKARLNEIAEDRLAKRQKARPVERAALAYARWQGLTDEKGIDTDAQKQLLDRTLDELDQMEPEVWQDLLPLASELGDTVLVGLMRYSLKRGAEQLREQQMNAAPTEQPGNAPRKRRRERDR